MPYQFKNKNLDCRSNFANYICGLLVKKHDGNIVEAVKDAKTLYDYSRECLRNVYQFIDTEIPLFALYELETLPKDDWDWDGLEISFDDAYRLTLKACKEFYIDQ